MKQFLSWLKDRLKLETPLPPDWDKEIFKGSFKKQLQYALNKSTKIGTGSSRVVFVIPFEGRDTVIKIAKNNKGLAQNAKETDYGLHHMYGGLLIPLIDHDEINDPPRWIQFEKASKITPTQFKQLTSMSFKNFGNMLQDAMQQRQTNNRMQPNWKYNIPKEEQEQIQNSEFFHEVVLMCVDFDFLVGDFTRLANWGIYKGKPVIIDYGFDENIRQEFYL